MADYSLDALAARNVLLYQEEQAQATGGYFDSNCRPIQPGGAARVTAPGIPEDKET